MASTGAACYVGSGLASYTNLHIDDFALLAAAARDRGTPGALYHGAGGETPNRWIAEAVARDLGCPVRSLDLAEAAGVWGELGALITSASSRSRAPQAHAELGWVSEQTDMLSQVGEPRLRALSVG